MLPCAVLLVGAHPARHPPQIESLTEPATVCMVAVHETRPSWMLLRNGDVVIKHECTRVALDLEPAAQRRRPQKVGGAMHWIRPVGHVDMIEVISLNVFHTAIFTAPELTPIHKTRSIGGPEPSV